MSTQDATAIQIPRPAVPLPGVQVEATSPKDGCTALGCGSQATVELHPYHGRRCSDHATLPPDGFRSDLAGEMAAMGRTDAAFTYLAAWLRGETDERFDTAVKAVP